MYAKHMGYTCTHGLILGHVWNPKAVVCGTVSILTIVESDSSVTGQYQPPRQHFSSLQMMRNIRWTGWGSRQVALKSITISS